jgi:rhamnosyltransferase
MDSHVAGWYADARPRHNRAVATPEVSVVIRARDEAHNLERLLELLRGQGLGRALELVVVDSGSRDDTIGVARAHRARVITIPPAAFTFGAALNLGAANARGQTLVSLSAHAFPPDGGWLARMAAALSDPRVACASGYRHGPEGAPLAEPVAQDLELALRHPEWGYSNGAGAFRARLWRLRPFRADLPGCEDLEWARHWLEHGYVTIIDPALVVEHDHTHDPLPAIFRRARREAEGVGLFADLAPYGVGELARDWWSDLRWYRSAVRARLSHRRAARLLGTYAGRRRARSRYR